MDEKKVKVIQDWPTPKSVSEVRSFYRFTSFYRHFMNDFNTLAAPLNEIVKKPVGFKWGHEQESTFNLLKDKLFCAFVLSLFYFTKAYFSEMLSRATLNYLIYDKE